MNELEKIAYAKSFIDKLSLGIDPTTGEQVSRNDVIFNPRISKCLSYVSEILNHLVINNGRLPAEYRNHLTEFQLGEANRDSFRFSDEPISISEFCSRINELADLTVCKKLSAAKVNEWLIRVRFLEVIENTENSASSSKTKKYPTAQGFEMGISTELRQGSKGSYTVLLYNRNMQKFMLDNIDGIISYINSKDEY